MLSEPLILHGFSDRASVVTPTFLRAGRTDGGGGLQYIYLRLHERRPNRGESEREREGSVLGDVHRRLQDHLQLKDAVLLRRPLVEEGSRPPSKAFDIGYWEQHA